MKEFAKFFIKSPFSSLMVSWGIGNLVLSMILFLNKEQITTFIGVIFPNLSSTKSVQLTSIIIQIYLAFSLLLISIGMYKNRPASPQTPAGLSKEDSKAQGIHAAAPNQGVEPAAYSGSRPASGCLSKTEETQGMPLPQFHRVGELPEDVHQATIDEVMAQFGSGTPQRQAVTARLQHIYHLARATGKLERLMLFGSYITAKPDPNDVDIILVMRNDFDVQACDEKSQQLFDHRRAEETFGASVFWIRPALLVPETLAEFIAHWQITRDQTRRGIVEVQS